MEARSTLVFSFRGATAIVRRGSFIAGTSQEGQICSDIASALILLQREGVVPFEEFRESISFLGELPNNERISEYLSTHLLGLIWTEVPHREF